MSEKDLFKVEINNQIETFTFFPFYLNNEIKDAVEYLKENENVKVYIVLPEHTKQSEIIVNTKLMFYVFTNNDQYFYLDSKGESKPFDYSIVENKLVTELTLEVAEHLLYQKLKKDGVLIDSVTYATAESITGGRLQSFFTKLNGSSNYFRGGITAYATDVKVSALNVDESVALKNNSVCQQTVEEMAEGCFKMFGSDVSIATSGYVQSFEWDDTKYKAMMYVAVRLSSKITGGEPITKSRQFMLNEQGSRSENLDDSVDIVLNLVKSLMESYNIPETRFELTSF